MSSTLFRKRGLVEVRLARYARRIPSMRPRLTELFIADLRDLHDVLERTALSGHYWVWGGLLLGWAREGALLPHDDDADFGVTDDDFHRLVSAVPEITKAGFRCDRRFINNDGRVTEAVFIRHGVRFEFFRMFPDAGRLRYFMYSDERGEAIQLEASVPDQATVPFSFLGRSWLKHEDHELELSSMYGAWEIPDPSWSYLNGSDIDARRPWHETGFDWRGGATALTGNIAQQARGR
jgi:LicD family